MWGYSIGTVEATLSSFLDTELHLSVQQIALAFLVMSVSLMVGTPLMTNSPVWASPCP